MAITLITSEHIEALAGRGTSAGPSGGAPAARGRAAEPGPIEPRPQRGGEQASWKTSLATAAIGITVVTVAWVLAVNLIADATFARGAAAPTPVEGLTIFAVFFVAAAGIERFLEPIANIVSSKSSVPDKTATAVEKWTAWKDAATDAAAAGATDELRKNEASARSAAEDAMSELAKATSKSETASDWLKVAMWAVATATGIFASAALKLYLLRQVGIADAPRSLEILATGLIIGAGTKPLHDLVKLLETKKDTAASAATGS